MRVKVQDNLYLIKSVKANHNTLVIFTFDTTKPVIVFDIPKSMRQNEILRQLLEDGFVDLSYEKILKDSE